MRTSLNDRKASFKLLGFDTLYAIIAEVPVGDGEVKHVKSPRWLINMTKAFPLSLQSFFDVSIFSHAAFRTFIEPAVGRQTIVSIVPGPS